MPRLPKYENLSPELTAKIEHENRTLTYKDMAFDDKSVIRRRPEADVANVWRKPFIRDIDKIMHCPYFNRYADKTQVYSLCKNDDMTRRNLHVQLVSRISRTIGSALHLNLDLIEAISLGHDLGHPAFAHTGEKYLGELYHKHTGRYFLHNIHSVRVLDTIHPYNISLQTLNDIAAHNGEIELDEYVPVQITSFDELDKMIERCYEDLEFASHIMPCTLEGAVVRISDIIAYLGKDRQDAIRAKAATEGDFTDEDIGSINAEIINNLVVNIIENSYGRNCIRLDAKHFKALRRAKQQNYEKIYNHAAAYARLDVTVKPMMAEIYGQLLDDLKNGRKYSPIYTQHINVVNKSYYRHAVPYESGEPNQLVVDYIASMTDDYFIDLHKYMFPNAQYPVIYRGYFDDLEKYENV
ncbi:MAG: HD domain-containing protein [Ruminococcaceae bacterium]|nr:HD domain-containing protein [Oscillospiraceae bacterium]